MKRNFPILAASILIIAVCASQSLAAPGKPQGAVVPVIPSADPLLILWQERIVPAKTGNYDAAEKLIDRIIFEQHKRGISNLPVYSAALAYEADALAAGGDFAKAYDLLQQAELLSPDYYGTYSVQWRLQVKEGKIFEAVGSLIKTYKIEYSLFQSAYPNIFNKSAVALIAYCVLLLVFAVFMLLRYARLGAHDLQELSTGFDKRGSAIMAYSLAFFPAIFIPNIVLYSFLIVLLLWIYMNLSERIVAAILALLLLSMPIPFKAIGVGLAAANEPVFESIIKIREGVWSSADIAHLEKALAENAKHPSRDLIALSLAKGYIYTGKYDDALVKLAEVSENRYQIQALVLSGNAYFFKEDYSRAIAYYEKATSSAPLNPIARFNLATALSRPEIVQLNADNVDKAEKEIQKVKEIDAEMLDVWTRYQSLDPGRYVVDFSIPLNAIFDDVWKPTEDRTAIENQVFEYFSGGIGIKSVPVVSFVILVLMGVLTVLNMKIKHAVECESCGDSICHRCVSGVVETSGAKGLCGRCRNVSEAKSGITPKTREQIRAEIRLKKHRRALMGEIISSIVPGVGHLYLGKTVRGIIFTIVSLCMVMAVVYRNGILRSELVVPNVSAFFAVAAALAVYIVTIAFCVWNVSEKD